MRSIRTIFLLVSVAVLVFVLLGCSTTKGTNTKIESDKRISEAIDTLAEFWEENYKDNKIDDKYLKIINTRIINIKNKIDEEDVYNKQGLFEDVDYIVEFDLLSNYFDTTPYYSNAGINNCVVVYDDGTMNVRMNPLLQYRTTTYSNDVSPIIDSIEDLGGRYNHVIEME